MFATIYLPNFYLQAALRHQSPSPTTPVALIDEKEKKAVIIQINPSAEAAGVHIGMTPSQGLARSLSLVIKTRSQSQENSIQQIVLHYAFSLSPYVELTGPAVTTMQFSQNRDLFPKLTNVIEQLGNCAIIAQAGLAQTPDTSFLAAHLARPVLQIEDPKKFLAPLPIDTLAIAVES
jgi:nucleotidyltransferase/DNA polymerase involved in DNA repair